MDTEDGVTTDEVETPSQETDLLDYNLMDENGNPLPLDSNGNPIRIASDNERSTTHSPQGSPMGFESDEDMNDNTERQRSAQESLTERLHVNGLKMRQIINRDPVQTPDP